MLSRIYFFARTLLLRTSSLRTAHRPRRECRVWFFIFALALPLPRAFAQNAPTTPTTTQGTAVAGPPSHETRQLDVLSAIATARQAVRDHPDSAADYLALGLALVSAKEKESASVAFSRALTLDPRLAEACYQLALLRADEGKWSEAVKQLHKALANAPNHALAHLLLGEMHLRIGDFQRAAAELSAVLKLNPAETGALHGLGLIRLQEGDLVGAEAEFRHAISLKPNHLLAEQGLGATLVRERKCAEAIPILRRVVAADPTSIEAANALGSALAYIDDRAGAAEAFGHARELSSKQLALQRAQGENDRGNKLWHEGNLQGALAALQNSVVADPDYPEAHNNLGGVFWQLGQLSEATAQFREAIRCRADFAQAHNNLGRALLEFGHPDQALQEFRSALAYRPGLAVAHFNLGKVLALKSPAEAETELRRALILDPGFAGAHVELGLLLASRMPRLSREARDELLEGLRLEPALRSMIPTEYSRELP